MNTSAILHKEVGGRQIASIKTVVKGRADIPPLFGLLQQTCGDAICGPAMAVFHYGAVKDGVLVEAAYPVSRQVESGEVHTRLLEKRKAWTVVHNGAPETNRAATQEIFAYLDSHAGTVGGGTREIYLTLDSHKPENNVTEIQVLDHEWHERLSSGVQEVLGGEAQQRVMQGIEALTAESSAEEYRTWIHEAMRRLDALTDDPEEKYRIVSCAAHVFPQHRIDRMKSIYEQRHEIDDVLKEMYTDPDWYEMPVRKGNQLFMVKVPFDAEAYQKATSPVERHQAYCHCSFVRPYLKEMSAGISPTFCWCGAGWYRRLWEGVLGKPIQVEHVETLVSGGDCCKLVITLPIHAEGELYPPVHEE